MVPRGDYQQLAACAFRLLDDTALAQRLIEQARGECRKYDWASVRRQWLNIYGDLDQPHAKLEENQRPAL
jgi:glycosyltransferase involved in cell wall biosynthesis